MKYAVSYKGFLNPFFVNRIRHDSPIGTICDGKVKVDSETLHFDDTCPFEDGTEVKVTLDANFHVESLADINKRKRAALKSLHKNEKLQKRIDNRARDIAEDFNKSLNLPFEWQVSFKPVLSGLSENSHGNGQNRSTVQHIQVLEDISIGRLHRNKGDFLCSKDAGKQWLGQMHPSIRTDGDGNNYMPKVTCKTCLKRAKAIK